MCDVKYVLDVEQYTLIKKINELKETYESLMFRQSGLVDKFARNLSDIRKLERGAGIIEPNTAIDTLLLKLHYEKNKIKGLLVQ